jgi:hypothetical protein
MWFLTEQPFRRRRHEDIDGIVRGASHSSAGLWQPRRIVATVSSGYAWGLHVMQWQYFEQLLLLWWQGERADDPHI